jgi:hypothetical protein
MSPGTFLQHLKAIEGPQLAGPRPFRTGSTPSRRSHRRTPRPPWDAERSRGVMASHGAPPHFGARESVKSYPLVSVGFSALVHGSWIRPRVGPRRRAATDSGVRVS